MNRGQAGNELRELAAASAGVALVRADGEAFEACGVVDREEATWVARALGPTRSATFELTAGKRVRSIEAFEVSPGTALVIVRDGRPLDPAHLDRALGSLRASRGPGLSGARGDAAGPPAAVCAPSSRA